MVACSSSLCLTSFIAVIVVLFKPTKILFYFTPSEGEADIGRGHPSRSKPFGVLMLRDRYPEGAVLIAGADCIFSAPTTMYHPYFFAPSLHVRRFAVTICGLNALPIT